MEKKDYPQGSPSFPLFSLEKTLFKINRTYVARFYVVYV